MTSDEPLPPPEADLRAEVVAAREFEPARKGYDREEVRTFLAAVAAALEMSAERIADLERRLVRATVDSGGVSDLGGADEELVLEAVSAELWRDDVLADLDRRRRELNAEIVRLRAGRDQLRGDLADVLSGMGEQLRRLDGALVAARAAGEVEERRIRAEPPLSSEERQAELEAARLAGFVTIGSAGSAPHAAESAEEDPPAAADTTEAPMTSASPAGTEDRSAPEGVADEDVDSLFARLRAERTADRGATGPTGAAC